MYCVDCYHKMQLYWIKQSLFLTFNTLFIHSFPTASLGLVLNQQSAGPSYNNQALTLFNRKKTLRTKSSENCVCNKTVSYKLGVPTH